MPSKYPSFLSLGCYNSEVFFTVSTQDSAPFTYKAGWAAFSPCVSSPLSEQHFLHFPSKRCLLNPCLEWLLGKPKLRRKQRTSALCACYSFVQPGQGVWFLRSSSPGLQVMVPKSQDFRNLRSWFWVGFCWQRNILDRWAVILRPFSRAVLSWPLPIHGVA